MFQTKVEEKISNTHFMINNIFFKKRAIYEIMWKNTVQLDGPQILIWCMCIACWITNATDTHSEYVILNSFLTATIIAYTHRNVTLHVHYLCCSTHCQIHRTQYLFLNHTDELPLCMAHTVWSCLFQHSKFLTSLTLRCQQSAGHKSYLPRDFPGGNTSASTGSRRPSPFLPSPVPTTYPICAMRREPIP